MARCRNVLAMQSRRRDKRSPTVPLIVHRNGVKETIQVSRTEYPTYLTTPLFPPPAVFWSNSPVRGVFVNLDTIHLAGTNFGRQASSTQGPTSLGLTRTFQPRILQGPWQRSGFARPSPPWGSPHSPHPNGKVILGSDPCIGYWVGSWYGEPVNGTHGLREIRVRCSQPNSQIHAFVSLFAQFGAPEYHVLLGPADPSFVASSAWAVSIELTAADVTLGMISAIGNCQVASAYGTFGY